MADASGFTKVSADVEGVARLRRELKKAGGDLSQLREANRNAAASILPIAEGLAPKRTGRLAATIRTGATNKAGILRAGRKSIPYAGPIHWGWPVRGIRPQPYLAEAAQGNEDIWIGAYTEAIDKAIKQVEGKY